MMRLLRVVVAVWLLLTALIVVARLFRNTNVEANTLSKLGFGICNGQPCFLGIVPGVTTGRQAYDLLSQYEALPPYTEGQDITARVNNMGFALIINHETEKIISIQIPVHQNMEFPQFDSFISMYGVPCTVGVFKDSQRLDLHYPNISLGSQGVEGRLSSHSNLWYVALTSTEVSTHNCPYDESEDYSVRPWLGFGVTFANRYKHS